MGVTAIKGPEIVYGTRSPLGNLGSENPDLGPSLDWGGRAIFDQRIGYNVTRLGAIGWYAMPDLCVINQVPSTITTANLAALQVPVAATPLTLVAATGAGITVLATATQVWASGNTIAASSLAIDGAPGLLSCGTGGIVGGPTRISLYDPTKSISRNLRFTSAGDDSAATITIVGADLYGYTQTETVTLSNATVAASKKAFKFVTSITPAGTLSGSNISVGTGDVYGLPLRADFFGFVTVNWNGTGVTASTGFVAADTTSPATATTGDVRGTYAVQTASDNAKRLIVFVVPSPSNIATMTTANQAVAAGLFGVAPV